VLRNVNLLALTFIESFVTILVERAAYFYCQNRLGYSATDNLWLALASGLTYIGGALASHGISHRLGERRFLLIVLAGQILLYAWLALWPTSVVVFLGTTAMGLVFGLKWPVVESYASAGYNPTDTSKAIGRFNLSWALAVPAALAVAGVLIAWHEGAVFALGGAISLVSVALTCLLTPRPIHLAVDHPERPDAGQTVRLGHLMVAARWLMLASYSCMWILATLLPDIFSRLNLAVSRGAALSGVLDVARVTAFGVLGFTSAWHGRRASLGRAMWMLPAGFLLVLAAPALPEGLAAARLPALLAGELLFGWTAGEVYFAALYYAMVVKNASVAAGGGHESLIGLGFALGPAAGLAGVALKALLGSQLAGILSVAGVLMLVCSLAAARSLLRAGPKTTIVRPA
jgi:predicted MFS family arabinose efflux permease